jgi:hypothetical protein
MIPPSTRRATPEVYFEASLARNSAAPMISCGSARAWFDHLERFGAFERLWRQQAPDELKAVGIAAEQRSATDLGKQLARIRGVNDGDPMLQGVAFESLVEGMWYFHRRANANRTDIVTALVDAARRLITQA